MSYSPQTAQIQIARELRAVEDAANDAIAKAAALMSTLASARADTGVVVHTGQKALIRLAEAQKDFVSASSNIFRVHDEMSGIGREMGLLDEEGSTPKFGLAAVDKAELAA